MNKMLAFGAVLCLAMAAAVCPAQTLSNPEHAAASARVMSKYHDLILYAQLLPINFTQPQWNTVLAAVEQARAQVRKTEDNEYTVLVGDESMLDDMITAATTKGQIPDVNKLRKFVTDINKLHTVRAVIGGSNTATVIDAIKKTADSGQLKEMQNSLDIHGIDPSKDPAKMTDDEKLTFFVQNVILDPAAYPLMVKIAATASKK